MPSKSIIQYAKNACKKSACEHMLAAVIFKGGAVIRVACNENKPLSYRKKYFTHGEPSRHAEMNVIHGIPRDVISGCNLLVVRLNKKGELRSAKPCLACAKALYDAGLKRVFYSSYSGDIVRLNFDELIEGNYSKEHICNF